MPRSVFDRPRGALLLLPGLLAIATVACNGCGAAPSATSAEGASSGPSVSEPAPAESSGATAAGDIPDDAVFLTYTGTSPRFSIQYVEGWQVSQQPNGVVIRDKDSSETVAVVAATDPRGFLSSTDLPDLQSRSGFKLLEQDEVKVGAASYQHLVFQLLAPPDPVTGKQVPSTVDRYYVPGPLGLALISLSTPDGVDNVDAFRQMIQSFSWS